uniref:Uncharacterized protein n=1 Tax=Peronospora matthiolae TaxID=2874970 RepID=A0AAV1UFD9_9STRA
MLVAANEVADIVGTGSGTGGASAAGADVAANGGAFEDVVDLPLVTLFRCGRYL